MKTKNKFTQQEMDNFYEYEEVRLSGLCNMFSPQARLATGLSQADYMFCMKNYSELKEESQRTSKE